MSFSEHDNIGPDSNSAQKKPAARSRLYAILLPVAILVIGALVSTWMLQTKPKAKTRPKPRNATLVEVLPTHYGPQQTTIEAIGLVKPARQVELKPQVSGEIIYISDNFLPGGRFDKGDTLVRIDPTDYELAVRQRASEVAQAKAELALEQGNQLVAQKEFELLGQPVSPEEKDLMLRKPQIESSKANYEAALATLEQAKLDLKRTTITAPFNAVVDSRQANLGTRVTSGSSIATLVGTDNYWIEASVPVSQLDWISIPQQQGEPGSTVQLFDTSSWNKGADRFGEVVGVAAAVEEQGRMARLLVNIPDPLALSKENRSKPIVLLDTSLQVKIEGKTLPRVAAIDRRHLHDNDTIWLMTDDRLELRPVEVAFRDRDHVYISEGLKEGEKIIVSGLPAPVEGMSLRLKGDDADSEKVTQQ
ncbi:MAG: efflux RND transporter periplasmic adaptor subunit [Desulfuromonas sp.]|nr:MAG: efflux RND transporter periplasmic adaptor subunit [Desulfuromonas sp.]